ncbi:MAG: hypothetical protein MRJ96_11225 [Nitrospirales bacterium]|nr:hypothetical protein [Nitrospira sp.]MDR4502012.1 hypothetical protein [Nitrospirales bacterium]
MHTIPWPIIMLSVILTVPAMAGVETPIELSTIPETILTEAKLKFPDATYQSANTETEPDGGFVYEIQGIFKDGRKFEYDVYPDGVIQEIEVVFQESMVPGAVMKAIRRKLPGFIPTYIEASHSASMKVVGYEFVGHMGSHEIDIDVSADGSMIQVADK